jgi:ABC-2 type transport system ATP-binding protein
MDEAERLCDRVAVMECGRVIALDTPQGLIASHGGGLRAVFSCEPATDLEFLASVEGVSELTRRGRRIEVAGDGRHIALVAAALVAHGIAPDDLRVEHASLEDVFLRLTGHGMEE